MLSAIHRVPVPDTQDVDDLLLPVHVDDRSVVSDPKLVRLDRTKAGQVARRALCDRPELARDSRSNNLVELAELLRRELGELDSEGQPLIPLPSTVPEGSSYQP